MSSDIMATVDKQLDSVITGAKKAAEALKSKLAELEARKSALRSKKEQMQAECLEHLSTAKDHTDLSSKSPASAKLRRVDSKKLNLVKLNVGGKNVEVRRSTVCHIPSRLSWILSGRWDHILPKDKDGRLFFDYDAEWFEPILNHLRDLAIQDPDTPLVPPSVQQEHEVGFRSLVSFFGLEKILAPNAASSADVDSTILKEKSMTDELIRLTVESLRQEGQVSMELLYRGSRDTFAAAAFHQRCDGKDNTVTIVKASNGSVFGGFADLAWSSSGSYASSESAFLFSLSIAGSTGQPTVRHPVVANKQQALFHHSSMLAGFGGNDLRIAHLCNTNTSSSINLGGTYQNFGHPNSLTGGLSNFQVTEIEVFRVDVCSRQDRAILYNNYIKNSFEAASQDSAAIDRFANLKDALMVFDDYSDFLLNQSLVLQHQFKELERDEVDFQNEISFMSKLNTEGSCLVGGGGDKATYGGILHFNVGGTKYCISKQTLFQAPESMLCTQYCSDRWVHEEGELDDNGDIFLDLNPYCVGKVFTKLRLLALASSNGVNGDSRRQMTKVTINTSSRASFEIVRNYFQIDVDLFKTFDSKIEEVDFFSDQLGLLVGAGVWNLLYRGSRDGFEAETFHRLCNGRPATLTVVRSVDGSVFGGFADVAWSSSGQYAPSQKAFLFSLSVRGVRAMKQCRLTASGQSNQNALFHNGSYLATFGGGHDLHIANACHSNSASYSNLGNSFQNHGDVHLLAGARQFQVSEIEVFQIKK